MNRRLIASIATAACAIMPLATGPVGQASAQSVMRPSQDIVLSIGRGELVTVPGNMADIFIANDAVADVQVKSARQLYIFGRSGGETTLYASNSAGEVIWAANVRVGSNIDSIDQMLALAMPEADISVATMGSNTILLTGTVAAPEDAAEVERLVAAFVGEGANVVSRLKMATPLQVNLKVQFAEVSRSLVRALGANLNAYDTTDGFQIAVGSGRDFMTQYTPGAPVGPGTSGGANVSVVAPITPGATVGAFGRLFGLDLASALDLAERDGLVTTLSEPNLTALSGETANFLAGGEYPIPISQGLGTTAVEYKNYGVSLAYTPTVLENGRISIRVRPEVSELTSQGAVTLNGFQIPALTIRRAETTVELGSGQSFMIAGLMSNNANNTIDKTPGVGDIPIIGNLFKSTEFRKGQTELVIIVTPYLVKPVSANEIKLPTDGFRSATAIEQFFGVENAGESGASRPMPRAADEGAPPPEVSLNGSEDANRQRLAGETEAGEGRSANAEAQPGFSFE